MSPLDTARRQTAAHRSHALGVSGPIHDKHGYFTAHRVMLSKEEIDQKSFHSISRKMRRPAQGSTGVLKTSRLPTWVVNFAKPTPKFGWMRFCVGSPLKLCAGK